MQMAHINSSYDKYQGSDMHPDYDISWNNSSDNSTVNGSLNNNHRHPRNDDFNSEQDNDDYTEFVFQVYDFEEKIYAYVWTLIVILTAFGNVLIVAVFVRKSMRTTTNLILLFIAISDSLTGFVTLPTYIHVFMTVKLGWVSLTKGWCEAFMISKLYIFKAFHTVSVWLTLLLGFQRFICVWFPFLKKSWFGIRRTLIAVAVITTCAFVIHIYHLHRRKADNIDGYCQWVIEDSCVETCIFLWMTLLFVNIVPPLLLLVLTILIIQKLFRRNIRKNSFTTEQRHERDQQNKTASIIVVCIAIIFLLPEIPYGIFLLVTVIKKHSEKDILPLRDNRIFHITYEIAVLLGFHANFWVYIIMNRRFRDEFKFMFKDFIRKFRPKRTTVPIRPSTVSMETCQSQSSSTKIQDVNELSTFV
ncbi:hypothetical protein ACJMK2_007216 [Sinanodonta woodiana]|uniref:G-protein coupled receptors family 1 profile domain-containing protein n=1 Tax=Sinanodonta woodiana TaxID=1069815 RepID=A0ABD3VI11_SINWO